MGHFNVLYLDHLKDNLFACITTGVNKLIFSYYIILS